MFWGLSHTAGNKTTLRPYSECHSECPQPQESTQGHLYLPFLVVLHGWQAYQPQLSISLNVQRGDRPEGLRHWVDDEADPLHCEPTYQTLRASQESL